MVDFSKTRSVFALPENIIYLDGNSLGPLSLDVDARLSGAVTREWGQMLITAWNKADWMELPHRIGNRIARLIGAEQDAVTMGDTLSVKVYQALSAAISLRPERKVILSDNGNFPSDLYITQGLLRQLGQGYTLKVVDPEAVEDAIDESVAAILITEIDYRTGRRHDMAALSAKAHSVGALAIWDLAHSAGAFNPEVAKGGADFAVGCTYKYLNGGPGSPAFIYAAPRLADDVAPALSGWLGHESPFAFDLDYRPAQGVERFRIGTPPVLALQALDAALDVWDKVDMEALRAQSLKLTDLFIAKVEAACPALTLVTPRDHARRGSQVSFRFEEGYAAMQALIHEGVIGDFRAPDIMRFGFAPLYNSEEDVIRAAEILARVLDEKLYLLPEFQRKNKVT